MTVQIRELRVTFGGRCVAHVPDLAIPAGTVVGLVGESGSGKSMTATAILGLADRLGAEVTGSIRLGETELVGAPETLLRHVRGRRIAMIFQSPATSFHPLMKLGDFMARALKLHGSISRRAARDRAESAVKEMLLPPAILDRYPHQLSGGQLQRVAIALALALDAEVLLADEPTSALDVTVQAEILALLTKLRDTRNLAVLLISHDLGAVSEVADTLAVMRDGEVVELGDTRGVISSPQHSYTRDLLNSVPVLGSVEGRQPHAPGT
jgi:ABC-type glutathione transport system ATPase component